MEDQNNNVMRQNIEVSEGKPPRKKKNRVFIITAVLAVLFVSCGIILGGDDSSTTTTTTESSNKPEITEDNEDEAVEKETEEADEGAVEESVEKVKDPAHAYVGDYFLYDGGLLLGISDAGIINTSMGNDVVYVDMELENTADDAVLEMHFSWFSMYIDDYQVETSTNYYIEGEDIPTTSIDINPGRKARFSFRSALPSDYDKAGKIEVGLPGSEEKTVLIKDNGVYVNGRLNVPVEEVYSINKYYGSYVTDDGRSLTLYWNEEEQVDGITIVFTNGVTFDGYLEILSDTAGKVYRMYNIASLATFTFTSDDTMEISSNMSDNAIVGTYQKVSTVAIEDEYGDIGNTGAGGLDDSMYGDHLSLDGLSYVLNFEPIDNGNGADALMTIKDGSVNYQWVLYMEDERTGYLSYMEEYVEVGTIYFSMDGIEIESSEYPEVNGLYW